MNRIYDFKKAKEIIEEYKLEISSADLGMQDDWYFTAQPVFEDGDYVKDLDSIDSIAGIAGSYKDTPILRLYYSDGKEQAFDVYKDVDDVEFQRVMQPVSDRVRKNMRDMADKLKQL